MPMAQIALARPKIPAIGPVPVLQLTSGRTHRSVLSLPRSPARAAAEPGLGLAQAAELQKTGTILIGVTTLKQRSTVSQRSIVTACPATVRCAPSRRCCRQVPTSRLRRGRVGTPACPSLAGGYDCAGCRWGGRVSSGKLSKSSPGQTSWPRISSRRVRGIWPAGSASDGWTRPALLKSPLAPC